MRYAFLAGGVLLLATACGGGQPTTTNRATGAPPSVTGTAPGATAAGQVSCNDGGAGTAAEIFDFGFRPSPITPGADLTVTWTNTGSTTHTVTFDAGPDCGSLASGETLSVLFPGAGSYAYHCTIHPAMKATVVV